MLTGIVLGVLQGVLEWLPVSSEGAVALSYSFLLDRPLDEAVGYALWLHGGTAVSALVVFRREVAALLRELVVLPQRPSRLFLYLAASTLISALVGFPLLLALEDVSSYAGALGMGLVGSLMVVTGAVQLRRRASGNRVPDDASVADAALAGVAQGLAVLPGLSRSGLTVATLLARGMDSRAALKLSFLMSIPAGVGAALYGIFSAEAVQTPEGLVAGAVAFIVGLMMIKALIAVAGRINFGVFVLSVGFLIVASAAWLLLTG